MGVNLVVNGVVYNGVESISMLNTEGQSVIFYPKIEMGYNNLLPSATDTDRKTIYGGDYNGDGVRDGYLLGYRLSSSGSLSSVSNNDCCVSGFIPVSDGDIVRIKGTKTVNGLATYVIAYNASNAKTGYKTFNTQANGAYGTSDWLTQKDGVLIIPITSANFGSGFNAIRFSGWIDENSIVTINEEIT